MREIKKWMLNCYTEMKQHGIKQSDVADKIGVSRETVNKALNGDNSMSNAQKRIEEAIEEIVKEREQ